MVAPKQVYVLLFNARSENEGIHTLQIGDRNVVLMFESEDDAIRFGGMLEAQDFPNPSWKRWRLRKLKNSAKVPAMSANSLKPGCWHYRRKQMWKKQTGNLMGRQLKNQRCLIWIEFAVS